MPKHPSPDDIMHEHLGWIKLYAEMMTVDNWRDREAYGENDAKTDPLPRL